MQGTGEPSEDIHVHTLKDIDVTGTETGANGLRRIIESRPLSRRHLSPKSRNMQKVSAALKLS